jgi:hypothetical protein
MVKLYAKGNFFQYINSSNLVFTDKLENVLITKKDTSSTSYSIRMSGIGLFVNDIAFSDIKDESGSAYASQSAFETYVYDNTGERVSSGGTSITNLSYTASSTNGIVTSDTGNDATIPLADGTNAGLLKPADFTKLSNLSGTNTGDQDLSTLVPYTGATTDVDLGNHILNAQSLHVKGTAGNGHLGLKHQSSDATASASETALFADSNGDIKWKNDGNYKTTLKTSTNTADRVYTLPDRTGTIADDTDITSAKSRSNHTGTQTASTISDLTTRINTDAPAETVSTIGALINGSTASTPNDTDLFALSDASTLKKLSGTNLKAYLKTYFDTLYSTSAFIPNIQPHEVFRGVSYRNNSTTEDTFGGITIATTGSATARSVATTNFATKQVRKGFVASVVSGGRYTGTRGSALLWYVEGGFRFVCDFYISDTAYAAGCRQFYGLQGGTADLGYSDSITVASLLNIIGVGSDTDTNLQIFHNDGSGTATKIDLGDNFPANRSAGAALTTSYSVELYNAPASTSVLYRVTNNETGAVATGTLTTDLPANTQGLNFFASRCMGGAGGVTNSGQFDLAILGVYSL